MCMFIQGREDHSVDAISGHWYRHSDPVQLTNGCLSLPTSAMCINVNTQLNKAYQGYLRGDCSATSRYSVDGVEHEANVSRMIEASAA